MPRRVRPRANPARGPGRAKIKHKGVTGGREGAGDKDGASLITIIRCHPLPLRLECARRFFSLGSRGDYEGHPEEPRIGSEEGARGR